MATAAVTAAEYAGDPSLDGRVEIRSPSPDEAAQAWILQKEAFSLSDAAARPPWGQQDVRVAVRDRRVVSCLTVLHAQLGIRGASYSMAGVRHVATSRGSETRATPARWSGGR